MRVKIKRLATGCSLLQTSGRKNWRIQKLENPVKNSSFESIVSARLTTAPRNRRERWRSRDNDLMMNQPSSYSADSLTIPSCHGHSILCSFLVPCNHCQHFSQFWDLLYGLFRLKTGTWHRGALLVPISHLLNWKILQFFRPLEEPYVWRIFCFVKGTWLSRKPTNWC